MPGAAREKCGEKTKWLAANPPNVFFLHRWTTLRRPRYNHRATAPQPAYGRRGPGHSPGGGRAAVRLSSRPLPVRAGHRWRVQVSLASRPNTCPCTPSACCPAQPNPPATPLPGPAAPDSHPCASRACALWQVGPFFARRGAEDHPPNRLRLAAEPPAPPPTATPGPRPLSTPFKPPTTTHPSTPFGCLYYLEVKNGPTTRVLLAQP